tara:strand:- start:36721 stop:37224 length:504 start_codon:yes stop_codon:yes gene_type:complete
MKEIKIEHKETQILLNQQLQDLYCLELECKDVLPKFKEVSKDENLKATLEAQYITLNSNLDNLEQLAAEEDIELLDEECLSLKGIIHKSEIYLEEGPVNDSGILSHVDRINQYKTAVYNSAVRFAKELNYKKLYKDLENIKNYTYNINDRLARLVDNHSDDRIIENL